MVQFATILLSIILGISWMNHPVKTHTPSPQKEIVDTTMVFKETGGRMDWCFKTNRIVMDMPAGKTTDIYSMDENGLDTINLTREMIGQELCGQKIEKYHQKGHPVWHPDGTYIVFQVMNEHVSNPPKMTEYITFGGNYDLWIMKSDGSLKQKLTENPKGYGILHARFSKDGNKLMWGECFNSSSDSSIFGSWHIVVANLEYSENGEVKIKDSFKLQPGGEKFYETNEFSADGKTIYFSSNIDSHKKSVNLYNWNTESKKLTKISEKPEVWEEMMLYSPTEKDTYAFISTRFFKWKPGMGYMTLRTDLFLNKSGKVHRLTYNNAAEKKNKLSKLHYFIGDYC